MIERLLDFCLKERLVVLVASVAIIAFGWYSTKKVPVDAIPNVGENQVIVLTDWPGRSPKDIEDQITYCLLYTSPSPRDQRGSRMPSSA